MISRSFKTVRRLREAWKQGNVFLVTVSFVRVGSQISPRRAKKDSNILSPGRTRSVKCPTPGPTKTIKSPPHALPLPPPPPTGFTLIGASPTEAWNKAKISPYTPLKTALPKREKHSTNNAFWLVESRDAYRLLLSLSAYHLYGKPGNSGENSNGTAHSGGNFPEKKVIPFEVFPFPRFYRNDRNFLYHLFRLLVPGFMSRESEKFTSIL